MSAEKDSLIKKAKRQMELIPSSAMPGDFFSDKEGALVGEFTGERFFAQRPEDYRMVVSLLAEGLGVIRIGSIMRVSPNTVMAVRDREGESIDIVKQRLAGLAHRGAAMLLEAVIEDVNDPVKRGKIATRDKAVAAAVLVDKGQLLSGEATMRVELTEQTAPDHDDYNAYIARLRSAKASGMGLVGETAGQKGGDLGGDGVPGTVIELAGTETQSEGKD